MKPRESNLLLKRMKSEESEFAVLNVVKNPNLSFKRVKPEESFGDRHKILRFVQDDNRYARSFAPFRMPIASLRMIHYRMTH